MVNLVLPQTIPDSEPEPKKVHQKRHLRQVVIYLFCLLLVALSLGGLWYAQTQGLLNFLRPSANPAGNTSSDSADLATTAPTEFKYPQALEELAVEALFKDNGNIKWLKKDGTVSGLTTLAKGDSLSAGAPIYDSPIFVGSGSWAVRKCVLGSGSEITCGLYRYDMDSKLLNTLSEKKTTNETRFGPIGVSGDGNLVAFVLNASSVDQSSSTEEIHVYDLSAKKDSLALSLTCKQTGGRGGGIEDSLKLLFSTSSDKLLYINTASDQCLSGEKETIYVFDVKSNAKLYSSGKGKTQDFAQAAWFDNDKFYFKDFSRAKEILVYDLTKKDYSSYLSETQPWYGLISLGAQAIYTVLPESIQKDSKPISKLIKDKQVTAGPDYFLPHDFLSGNYIYGELIGYCGGPCSGYFEFNTDGNAIYEISSGKLYRVKSEKLVTGAILDLKI